MQQIALMSHDLRRIHIVPDQHSLQIRIIAANSCQPSTHVDHLHQPLHVNVIRLRVAVLDLIRRAQRHSHEHGIRDGAARLLERGIDAANEEFLELQHLHEVFCVVAVAQALETVANGDQQGHGEEHGVGEDEFVEALPDCLLGVRDEDVAELVLEVTRLNLYDEFVTALLERGWLERMLHAASRWQGGWMSYKDRCEVEPERLQRHPDSIGRVIKGECAEGHGALGEGGFETAPRRPEWRGRRLTDDFFVNIFSLVGLALRLMFMASLRCGFDGMSSSGSGFGFGDFGLWSSLRFALIPPRLGLLARVRNKR